jgi:hypothetical protein
MKKIYTYAMMALMSVLTMTTFTGCMTEDEAIAYDLSGEWEGYMGEDYYSYWGYEGTGREYDTAIRFYRKGYSYSRGATSGYGEQVDYDPYHNDSRYREFLWSVSGGRIRLSYDTGQVVYIYDFNINNSRFTGYMECGNYKEIYFNLYKTTVDRWNTYYDWSQMPKALNNDSIKVTKE